jgi:hypothetical protein
MAKGKKTGGKNFEPGNKMGKGASCHNPALKVVRRMTHDDVAEIGQLIVEGNLEKLQAVKDDKNASVLKVWMCSVAIKAISRGDATALNALLDRIVGKVKDKVEVTSNNKTELSTETFKIEFID